MDVTQTLKNTENSLRDFIAFILNNHLGSDWEQKCGVSYDRLEVWKERKESERKRQESGAFDERLIYYADFYDLKTILKKHWTLFSDAFGEYKTCDVLLSELEKFRDPDAHRRELLPHQIYLILGISGELRTKIARYRNARESSETYYPRIEYVADNLGNSWKLGELTWVRTDMKLRPGDMLEYLVTASDTLEESLQYQFTFNQGNIWHSTQWSEKNSIIFEVTEEYAGELFCASIYTKSKKVYNATQATEDMVLFQYEVLPSR